MFSQIFFWYCATVIIACGLAAISLRNPVHSVLSVLLLFFHLAGLYLLLQAEFLAAVQIIVYAGAILVLYLFVLFLVNLKRELQLAPSSDLWLGRILAAMLFALLAATLPAFVVGGGGPANTAQVAAAGTGNARALGMELFTRYLLPFEIAGVILLVALIGGLVLAARTREERRGQHFLQEAPRADTAIPDPASAETSSEEEHS